MPCLVLGLAAASLADEKKIAGKYKLLYTVSGNDVPLAIVEVDTTDGKTTGKLLSSRAKGAKLDDFEVKDGRVTATLTAVGAEVELRGANSGR